MKALLLSTLLVLGLSVPALAEEGTSEVTVEQDKDGATVIIVVLDGAAAKLLYDTLEQNERIGTIPGGVNPSIPQDLAIALKAGQSINCSKITEAGSEKEPEYSCETALDKMGKVRPQR